MSENAPDGLDGALKAVNDSMVDGLGRLAEYFGFNKVMGQLYGALLLSPEAMSLDDLSDLLQKSKASVSMNMRSLEQLGIVREVWVRGDRRKYYEAETDFWVILQNVLRTRELRDVQNTLRILEDNVDALRESMPQMGQDDSHLAEFYINRIDALHDFFRLALLILNSILQQSGDVDVTGITGIRLEGDPPQDS